MVKLLVQGFWPTAHAPCVQHIAQSKPKMKAGGAKGQKPKFDPRGLKKSNAKKSVKAAKAKGIKGGKQAGGKPKFFKGKAGGKAGGKRGGRK